MAEGTPDVSLRGRMLSFDRAPEGPGDDGAYSYFEDGVLQCAGGKISYFGPAEGAEGPFERIDGLILPGFIDPHVHFPQVQVLGASASDLLDWLARHTFPAEMAYADEAHAARMAEAFFARMLANGTTTPVAYCATYPVSV